MKKIKILECTLRDGSYAVDFQFSIKDTQKICGSLDGAGFEYIEIGHGIGMGASESGKNVAAATDEEYMVAASSVVKKAKWGMFCIPGIATLDHVRKAADHGINFIRIGTELSEINSSEPFIALARNLGIQVFSNFMKSYVLSPDEFAEVAFRAYEFGSELVYIVDSAGGMLPSELQQYIQAIRAKNSLIPLGFHGHNNLGLAVANSLTCANEGVEIIDTSLQGFGRSAGNAPTEQFLSAIIRSGYQVDIDPITVMNLGEELVRPLIQRRGLSSLDVISGQALFHSSYMPNILLMAKRFRVDPRKLILELCKVDKINAPLNILEELAMKISGDNQIIGANLLTDLYYGKEQT